MLSMCCKCDAYLWFHPCPQVFQLAVPVLQTHCTCAAFFSDGPPAVVMMFTYKEVIEKMEKKLTDPKYHEVLVLDDEQAKEKLEQKNLEKEKEKEQRKGKSSPTTRLRKKPRLAESKDLFQGLGV